ncbi:MAG TPA: response regulator transcription factor [Anaeromyxobacteraceae bacterium]|nr:response regulator transcription factor [Anaeromyxobacteraceae bacterium]
MDPLRLLVVSADPLARGGLAALLGGVPGLAVVEQAASAREAQASLRRSAPEVAVFDVGPGDASSDLRDLAGQVPVVALLSAATQAAEALAAGARGAIFRDAPAERLAGALAAAAQGLVVLDAGVAASVVRATPAPDLDEPLTPRELEVLALLAEGLANKAIAARLGISEHTAKFHVNAILGKLGAESRSEAIVRAARLGLVVL